MIDDLLKRLDVNKEMFVAVPVLGTALSITYDVGYFYGVDINYFTMFSLSEHLVFASEALPFALIASVIIVFGLFVFDVGLLQNILRRGSSQESDREKREMRRVRLGLYAWFVISLLVAAYFRTWWALPISAAMIIFVVVVEFWPIVLLSKRALTSYATVASLIVVCWLGYYLGQAYLVGDRIFHKLVLVEGVMEGRIIRGGERGVLIYNPAAKEIVLLKWDAIKQIVSQPPSK